MERMTTEEIRAFLLSEPRTAKLATVREDGSPHIAPVWIDLDGEQVVFTTWHNTVKTSNMRRDPRLAICVDDQAPPFAFVSIEGTVTFSEDLEAVRYWATQIAGRYMGADLAQAYGQRNGVAGELLARVTPTRITAFKNISD